jgi:hypothetical protein
MGYYGVKRAHRIQPGARRRRAAEGATRRVEILWSQSAPGDYQRNSA